VTEARPSRRVSQDFAPAQIDSPQVEPATSALKGDGNERPEAPCEEEESSRPAAVPRLRLSLIGHDEDDEEAEAGSPQAQAGSLQAGSPTLGDFSPIACAERSPSPSRPEPRRVFAPAPRQAAAPPADAAARLAHAQRVAAALSPAPPAPAAADCSPATAAGLGSISRTIADLRLDDILSVRPLPLLPAPGAERLKSIKAAPQ